MEFITIKDATVEKAIKRGLIKLGLSSEAEADIKVIYEGKKGLFGFGAKDAEIEIAKKATLDKQSVEVKSADELEVEALVASILEDAERPQAPSSEIEIVTNPVIEEEKIVEEVVEIHEETGDTELFDDSEYDDFDEAEFSAEEGTVTDEERQNSLDMVAAYLQDVATVYGAPSTVTYDDKDHIITFHIETEKKGLIIGKHGNIINALQTLAQVLVHRYVRNRVSVVVNSGDYRERRFDILNHIADRTADKVIRTKQPVFLDPLPSSERKIIHARLSKNKNISTHSEGKEPHRYLVVDFARKRHY